MRCGRWGCRPCIDTFHRLTLICLACAPLAWFFKGNHRQGAAVIVE